VKIAIWVVLGALIVLINRKPEYSQVTWWVTILLGLTAILMATLKPF